MSTQVHVDQQGMRLDIDTIHSVHCPNCYSIIDIHCTLHINNIVNVIIVGCYR